MYVFWKGTKPMTNTEPFTDLELLIAISERGAQMYYRLGHIAKHEIKPVAAGIRMELGYAHRVVRPLRLQQLLDADDGNFAHDISGIHRYLDIKNNKFTDCFVPRFAA
jgi:hypothetical protein